MQETKTESSIRLKAVINKDHKLVIDMPEDWEEGEVEVLVRKPKKSSVAHIKQRIKEMELDGLERLPSDEVDDKVQEIRDSWDR